MARIISEGPIGAWQEVCKGCHYKVEFSPADIHEGRDEDDGTHCKYVVCPKCHKMIDMLKRERECDDY